MASEQSPRQSSMRSFVGSAGWQSSHSTTSPRISTSPSMEMEPPPPPSHTIPFEKHGAMFSQNSAHSAGTSMHWPCSHTYPSWQSGVSTHSSARPTELNDKKTAHKTTNAIAALFMTSPLQRPIANGAGPRSPPTSGPSKRQYRSAKAEPQAPPRRETRTRRFGQAGKAGTRIRTGCINERHQAFDRTSFQKRRFFTIARSSRSARCCRSTRRPCRSMSRWSGRNLLRNLRNWSRAGRFHHWSSRCRWCSRSRPRNRY